MTPHFKRSEFACPCCGENQIQLAFVLKLERIRVEAGVPFVVNSGYRCAKHNASLGSKPNSAHREGLAVDLAVTTSGARYVILDAAFTYDIPRIGIGETFIHLDISTKLPQMVAFDYYK